MKDRLGFTEEEMEAIRCVVTSECRHYSPVEGCQPLRRPCHMTSVNARDSPPCRHFAEVIVPRNRALRTLYERQIRMNEQMLGE